MSTGASTTSDRPKVCATAVWNAMRKTCPSCLNKWSNPMTNDPAKSDTDPCITGQPRRRFVATFQDCAGEHERLPEVTDPDEDDPFPKDNTPPIIRLRRLLKCALRAFRYRCVHIMEV